MNIKDLSEKYIDLRKQLMAKRNTEGFWKGQLSTSALSTAVAIVALRISDDQTDHEKISSGYKWLLENINKDGGYGDTPGSISNLSTTLLSYAAIKYCKTEENGITALTAMENWLSGKGIEIEPKTIAHSILSFYGKDYTFSIPILSMLVICGAIPETVLKELPVLPFELTLLPASWYRFFNMRVVSYALPALIGVGIFLYKHRKSRFLKTGIRGSFIKPAINKLNKLVPESGGFLEAIPLTGFVAMCLIASKEKDTITVTSGLNFLRSQQRDDGGWPIDTDLSTWVTTLSVKALSNHTLEEENTDKIEILRKHLLKVQYKEVHPFNGANPGGWGWTNYSGSVPDADDTAGAILALLEIYSGSNEEDIAIENGCRWLIDIQNNDGGFPTFCKGWGKLPFDRSCADLTGHALLALAKASEKLSGNAMLLTKIRHSINNALNYLSKNQMKNGSWVPLWFGNQLTDDKTNPIYGTGKICIYLVDCLKLTLSDTDIKNRITSMITGARIFLVTQQNTDGSWGGKINILGTIEETSLALGAIAGRDEEACLRGFEWLSKNEAQHAAPIGLYFAMLWYDEKLYPLIYYTEALRRFLDNKTL